MVGAINRSGIRSVWNSAEQSNYGSELDVVAPGTDIYSTDRQEDAGYNKLNTSTDLIDRDYTMKFGGTSAATAPYVSGVAALILSVNPNLTNTQVVNIIEGKAKKIGGYIYSSSSGRSNGSWNSQMGYGLVNAHAAVSAAINGPDALNVYSGTVKTYSIDNPPAGTVTWEKSAGSPFTISSTTGKSTNVNMTNTGTGTLTAKVNGTVVTTKSITVSPIPTLGPMTGPSVVQPGQTYVSYRLNLVQGQGLVYNWGSNEGILTEVGTTGDSEGLFNVSSSSGAGTDTVHCTVKTNNGTTVGVFYMNVSIEY